MDYFNTLKNDLSKNNKTNKFRTLICFNRPIAVFIRYNNSVVIYFNKYKKHILTINKSNVLDFTNKNIYETLLNYYFNRCK